MSKTPFFLFDGDRLRRNLERYSPRAFRLHYSLKACSAPPVLRRIAPLADGLTAASLADLRLAAELRPGGVHFHSPMTRGEEIDAVNRLARSISFNSLTSLDRLGPALADHVTVLVRVNPGLSLVGDGRHDPCRKDSKLGVPLDALGERLSRDGGPGRIRGIHFHNNCQGDDPGGLAATMERVERSLGRFLGAFEEVNVGGGYLFGQDLLDAVNRLGGEWSAKHGVRLVMEPGFDVVNDAGFLVASVVDVFRARGKRFAVLDAAVNHLPEVFEYGDVPKVRGHRDSNPSPCVLAGATCLAGDVFGEHRFARPPEVGDAVVFEEVGAYSHVKANQFNGLPLPEAYVGSLEDIDFARDVPAGVGTGVGEEGAYVAQ